MALCSISTLHVVVKRLSPWLSARQRSTVGEMKQRSLFCGGSKPTLLPPILKRSLNQIVEEGAGTHIPSAFQKRVMVLAKMYPSVDKVPERVTDMKDFNSIENYGKLKDVLRKPNVRNQLRLSMDKFRIRVSIIMCVMTAFAALGYAYVGRKERAEGKTLSDLSEIARKKT